MTLAVTITDVRSISGPGDWHCRWWGCGSREHVQRVRASAASCDPPPRRRTRRARRSRSGQPATHSSVVTMSHIPSLSHARSNKSPRWNWNKQPRNKKTVREIPDLSHYVQIIEIKTKIFLNIKKIGNLILELKNIQSTILEKILKHRIK